MICPSCKHETREALKVGVTARIDTDPPNHLRSADLYGCGNCGVQFLALALNCYRGTSTPDYTVTKGVLERTKEVPSDSVR